MQYLDYSLFETLSYNEAENQSFPITTILNHKNKHVIIQGTVVNSFTTGGTLTPSFFMIHSEQEYVATEMNNTQLTANLSGIGSNFYGFYVDDQLPFLIMVAPQAGSSFVAEYTDQPSFIPMGTSISMYIGHVMGYAPTGGDLYVRVDTLLGVTRK